MKESPESHLSPSSIHLATSGKKCNLCEISETILRFSFELKGEKSTLVLDEILIVAQLFLCAIIGHSANAHNDQQCRTLQLP